MNQIYDLLLKIETKTKNLKYLKKYCEFISFYSKRSKLENNFHRHHIIPRCMMPELNIKESEENIINLTPREHKFIHNVLGHAFPTHRIKMAYHLEYKDWSVLDHFNSGYLTAKSIRTGETKHIHKNDPRLESGEYIMHLTGTAIYKNLETGKKVRLSIVDERIEKENLVGILHGKKTDRTVAINKITGEIKTVYGSYELIGDEWEHYMKNKISVYDKILCKNVTISLSEFNSNRDIYRTFGENNRKSLYKNKDTGIITRLDKSDIRISSGEFIPHSATKDKVICFDTTTGKNKAFDKSSEDYLSGKVFSNNIKYVHILYNNEIVKITFEQYKLNHKNVILIPKNVKERRQSIARTITL